jgi:metallo-beta-lactamase family protein
MIIYQGFGGIDGIVAGSKHLFTLSNGNGIETILHDCGNNLGEDGEKKELYARPDSSLPFQAAKLNAVVISHAHEDHSGDIWKLRANFYSGYFFGTEPTKEIIDLDLQQSASREFERAKKFNDSIRGKKDSAGKFIDFQQPSFTYNNAKEIREKFQGLKYGMTVQVSKNVKATFYDAGHIIGSGQVLYEIEDNGRKIKILSCVDLGRSDFDTPIIRSPHTQFPDDIDYCFIESTYGGQKHQSRQQTKDQLEEVIMRGIKEKKRMLFGVFAKQRSQWVLNDFYQIFKKGNLPDNFKFYFDCPSAIGVNRVIMRHPECLDELARHDFKDKSQHPFKFPNLRIVQSRTESESLDFLPGPIAIASASGMWAMGRITRHLRHFIQDPSAQLFQTGYQAAGTAGQLLQEGKEKHPSINIDGQSYPFNAEVIRLKGYGAHADGEDCINHVLKNVKPRKKVFIVHGEKDQQDWMLNQFRQRQMPAEIVRKNQVYEL